MDIASLVIAIISLIIALGLSWIPCLTWVAFPLSLLLAFVAVIFGFIARSKAQKGNKPVGVATAGIIIGFITIGLAILVFILCIAFGLAFFGIAAAAEA